MRVRVIGHSFRTMAIAAVIALATNGCSTVVFSDSAVTERSAAIERAALISAAADVSEMNWPALREENWGSRLAGFVGDEEGVSRNEAVDVYIASLASDNRADLVLSDASRQLGAAKRLVAAAYAASEAVRPIKSDIGVVEDAIGDLREARDVYLASLKEIARRGEPVGDAAPRAVKTQFNEAIEALGEAADRLADRVARDRTETYAKPVRRGVDGSL